MKFDNFFISVWFKKYILNIFFKHNQNYEKFLSKDLLLTKTICLPKKSYND